MAIWRASRRADGTLAIHHIGAAGSQQLGVVRADTPEGMLISWYIDVGNAGAGDVIVLPFRHLMIIRGEADISPTCTDAS